MSSQRNQGRSQGQRKRRWLPDAERSEKWDKRSESSTVNQALSYGGTVSRTEVVIILWGLPLLFWLCEENVCSVFQMHSTISESEGKALVDLFVVDQQSTVVGLGHCSAPVHDVSYVSPCVALEITTLKPQLIRDADQSISNPLSVSVCFLTVSTVLVLKHQLHQPSAHCTVTVRGLAQCTRFGFKRLKSEKSVGCWWCWWCSGVGVGVVCCFCCFCCLLLAVCCVMFLLRVVCCVLCAVCCVWVVFVGVCMFLLSFFFFLLLICKFVVCFVLSVRS